MSNTTLTPAVASAVLAGVAAGIFPSSAFLWITEFKAPQQESPLAPTFPPAPSVADQVVAFGGVSAVSAPFGPQTRLVRIQTTGIAAIKFGGKAPVAVAGPIGGTQRMTAGQTEYFAVNPGDAVAAISSS